MNNTPIEFGDFLAGGGGVTEAVNKIPGIKIKWVLNHDQMAIRTNMHNHKNVKHYWTDIYKQDEHKMEPVDFAWASIECTQHSKAKGGDEKNIGSYMLGWEFVRYTKHLMPLVLGIENVPEFKDWSPMDENGNPDKTRKGEEFERWKKTICDLGYNYTERILNAADYGIATRRVRYFSFFTRKELGMNINWPVPTHNKDGLKGLKKWLACKSFIDLKNEGQSIFGRKLNPNVPKGKRKPLVHNTLRRIAGGIKKEFPELYFIFQYYSNGENVQDINLPLNTVTTKDRHVLVKMEKLQFIADHCHQDHYHKLNEPLAPQLTRQDKRFVTIEGQFLGDYYSRDDTSHPIHGPANTIRTENSKHIVSVQGKFLVQHYSGNHSSNIETQAPTITTVDHNSLVTAKANFISKQYNSNGKPEANNSSINDPLGTLSTEEKMQFISCYFNAAGKPETQNSNLDKPLNAILTGTNKQALITAIEKGEFDFDIKMRFLEPEELSMISSFPPNYFTDPLLRLTKKEQVKMIGNAVPPEWARQIIEPVVKELQEILTLKQVG